MYSGHIKHTVWLQRGHKAVCASRVSELPTRMRERKTVKTGFIKSSWQETEDS
jgi:hypothetical protein